MVSWEQGRGLQRESEDPPQTTEVVPSLDSGDWIRALLKEKHSSSGMCMEARPQRVRMLRRSQAAKDLVEGNGTSLHLFYIYKVFSELTIVQKKHIRRNYSRENLYDLPGDSVPRPLILGLV